MSARALDYLSILAIGAPFWAILVLLIYFQVKRTIWIRNRRRGNLSSGFCPSASAMGAILLFAQIFVRPSLVHALHAIRQEATDEDESGDPESPEKRMLRQYKRIQRGQPVGTLILRR